jgi:hypothetical protein
MNSLRLIKSAVATATAATAAVTLLAAGGQAAQPTSETLRVYEKARAIQLTKADGTVRNTLPIPEPEPGDTVDVVFDVFEGTHRKHGKTRIGTDHLRCSFVAAGPPDCISHAALGKSMIVVSGDRVVLGTGRYLGATGRVVSVKEVKGVPPTNIRHNDVDAVVQIKR